MANDVKPTGKRRKYTPPETGMFFPKTLSTVAGNSKKHGYRIDPYFTRTKHRAKSLGEKLKQRCKDIGQLDLFDKIADETQATTCEQLLEFLKRSGHPALSMPALL